MNGTSRSELALARKGVRPAVDRPVSIMVTLPVPPAAANGYLNFLTPAVRYVEIRADLAGDVDPAPLRAHAGTYSPRHPGPARAGSAALLYTLRSTAAGGACADPADRRRARLIAAADRYDCVDLEVPDDLHPDVLVAIPPERRVLSWHGAAGHPVTLAGLHRTLDIMTAVRARLYRLAPRAATLAQAIVPLRLLKEVGRDDVMAFARGPAGTWTRVLTARYGAPLVSGWLDAAAPAGTGPPPDGELPLPRLLADYPSHVVMGAERLYGIIGAEVTLSLSPQVHNTAYRSLDLPALFLPFSTQELPISLAELSAGLDDLGLPLCGATVIRPHKDAALALAHEITPLARRAHAACLLVRTGSGWWADTEAAGVVAALTGKGVEVAGRRIAVVGCGGAGRAAAAGLTLAGAEVTLVNRGESRGEHVAKLLDVPFTPLRDFDPRPFSVLVHATTVVKEPLFRLDGLDPAMVIFDLNYLATETPLIAAARTAGLRTIDGRDMLLAELSRQFQLMTGRLMPTAEVAAALAGRKGR